MIPFKAKAEDGRSEWQLIYEELLVGAQVGEVVNDQALSELVDRDWLTEGARTSPMSRAAMELERTHQRTLRRIVRVGYEVVEGAAQIMLAQGQIHRGHRRVHRGVQLTSTTNRDALNYEQTRRLDALQMIAERHDSELRRLDAKVAAQEKLLDGVREQHAETT